MPSAKFPPLLHLADVCIITAHPASSQNWRSGHPGVFPRVAPRQAAARSRCTDTLNRPLILINLACAAAPASLTAASRNMAPHNLLVLQIDALLVSIPELEEVPMISAISGNSGLLPRWVSFAIRKPSLDARS